MYHPIMASRTCRVRHLSVLPLLLVLAVISCQANAWISPLPSSSQVKIHDRKILYPTKTTLHASGEQNNNDRDGDKGGGILGFLSNPYESKIPPELKDEIYRAEANTPAAKDRASRIAVYVVIAVVGVLMAFFNALITEIRNSPLPPGEMGDPLTIAGFDWVNSNFLFSFLFTNKIGGGLCLLGGAGAGLLAEAELDTKRINAEKIFEEMERRRLGKGKVQQKQKKPSKKKRRSGKEQKRLQALSEIVEREETGKEEEETNVSDSQESTPEASTAPIKTASQKKDDDGLFGKIRGFYDKADAMAAAQARLLNKELEDRGVVEKITDDTGLKVIGREEAARLAAETEKQNDGSKKED